MTEAFLLYYKSVSFLFLNWILQQSKVDDDFIDGVSGAAWPD